MKCPRCGLEVTDAVPRCAGCDFSLGDLDRTAGSPPDKTGAVVDLSGKLSAEERAAVERALSDASAATGGEWCVVVTGEPPLPSTQWAFWLFNRWELGGDRHTGVLLSIALGPRRVDCEVGYAWEDALDEAATGEVLDEHVVPALQEGRLQDAVTAGVEALRAKLATTTEAA